jgi:NAD+ synthase (glutamine-hydrolysing)
VKVRAVQFSPLLGNIKENIKIHQREIKRAINDRIDLIVFPELSISGYHLKDIVYDVALRPSDVVMKGFTDLSRDIDIIIGAPLEEPVGIISNAALYFSKGKRIHTHRKVQLPNFGMFEEQMIFKPGNEFKSFKIKEFTAGILICREILFPVHAYLYFLQNVDFLIGISNSPHRGIGKEGFSTFKMWESMGYVYSVFYHQNYVFVNRTGFEDGIGYGGGSFFARSGKGIETMTPYMKDAVFDFEISLDDVRQSRISSNYLRDDRPDMILKEMKRILNV